MVRIIWLLDISSVSNCIFAGVRMTISGTDCLVIGIPFLLLGDIPAVRNMSGCTPSVSRTCYVRRPCRRCDILAHNMHASLTNPALRGMPRSLRSMHEYYITNGQRTGVPVAAWLLERMRRNGYSRIPVFVTLHNQPSPDRLCIDLMHCMWIGCLRRHFTQLVTILSSPGDLIFRAGAWVSLWKCISDEFAVYCRDNKLRLSSRFSSYAQFKKRIKAAAMKELAIASLGIFKKLGLIGDVAPPEGSQLLVKWKTRQRALKYWCMHVRISLIAEQHVLSLADVDLLELLISQLLVYFSVTFSENFITINVHSYTHLAEQVRLLGPPRLASNFGRESLIRLLKMSYRNTNFKNKEKSIFQHYTTTLFFFCT